MQNRRFSIASLAAALVVATQLPAWAQISPGTTLTGSINVSLNSKTAQVGERFLLTDVHSNNYDVNGGTVYGHVSHVVQAKNSKQNVTIPQGSVVNVQILVARKQAAR